MNLPSSTHSYLFVPVVLTPFGVHSAGLPTVSLSHVPTNFSSTFSSGGFGGTCADCSFVVSSQSTQGIVQPKSRPDPSQTNTGAAFMVILQMGHKEHPGHPA